MIYPNLYVQIYVSLMISRLAFLVCCIILSLVCLLMLFVSIEDIYHNTYTHKIIVHVLYNHAKMSFRHVRVCHIHVWTILSCYLMTVLQYIFTLISVWHISNITELCISYQLADSIRFDVIWLDACHVNHSWYCNGGAMIFKWNMSHLLEAMLG